MYYAVVAVAYRLCIANKLYILPPTHVYAFTVWCMYTYGAVYVMVLVHALITDLVV